MVSYLSTDKSSLMGSYDAHYTSYLYVRNVTNANLEALGSSKQVFYAIDRTGEKLVWDSVSSVASGYEMMSLIGLDSSVQIFDLTNGKQQFGSEVFPQRTVRGTRNLNIVNWQPFFNLNTSRESISKPRAYQVVPNPSNGSFQIMGLNESAVLELYSLDGRLLESFIGHPQSSIRPSSNLASGVYLLKILQGESSSVLRLVKN
ncbi:T9SS type A sorting domain-containing protein [Salibacteraceae bacterium]|nr:T9SS type A sorting domain-containing protein [Salibacteraceae bacterium]